MFQIIENHIVITTPNDQEYSVPLSRCDTYEKILSWVYHLSEKTWVTTEVVNEFIKTALNEHGLSYPHES